MLQFGMKPPFSFNRFLEMCEGIISGRDIEIIKIAGEIENYTYDESVPAIKKWHAFETALRNELVKIRAARRHKDPSGYLRGDVYAGPSISAVAMNAYKTVSPVESENMLDEERWRVLEELSAGHFFDIDFLSIYAVKLLMLEKREKIYAADKSGLVEDVLQKKSG